MYARVMSLALSLSGCSAGSTEGVSPGSGQGGPHVPPPITVRFALDFNAFTGDPLPAQFSVFTMLLGDMDLDGDLDYFLNRHNRLRMEVFENVGGSFVQINRKGHDRSGIWDNRGVPDLFAVRAAIVQEIDARGVPGIYLWHGPTMDDAWFLRVIPSATPTSDPIRIEANRPLTIVAGLDPSELTRIDPLTIDVRLADPTVARTFSVNNVGVSTQIKVTATAVPPPTIHVGPHFAAFPAGHVSLFKQDPHGMALVDGVGSVFPDLFIATGGLTGNLVPPLDPKEDRLFEHVGGATLFEETAPGIVPPNYTRGRQVAWVDVDADGDNELYVSNKLTPNQLYDVDGSVPFVDVAPGLGLDLIEAEPFAWLDVDLDGLLDILFLTGDGLAVGYNRVSTFEYVDGAELGLVLPGVRGDGSGELFRPTTFQIVDFDRDGDMDVWVSRFSTEEAIVLFRRDGARFTDVTFDVGLADVTDIRGLYPADIDNDGWIDIVTGGARLQWWRNLGGDSFEMHDIAPQANLPFSWRIAVGDVDNDGWIDIVHIGLIRSLLRNASAGANSLLEVSPTLPLGSVVRAYSSDGTVQAQQWGAVTVSRYSQSLQDLRFGQGPGVRITEISVQHPGDATERTRVPVAAGATHLNL